MKIGDRVRAAGQTGTLISPTPEQLARLTAQKKSSDAYWFVQFDGKGPNGDGYGIYSRFGYMVFRLPKKV